MKAVDQAAGFELDSRSAVSPCAICVVGRGRLPWAVSGQRERDVGVQGWPSPGSARWRAALRGHGRPDPVQEQRGARGPPARPPMPATGVPGDARGGRRLCRLFPRLPLRPHHAAVAGGAGWALLSKLRGLLMFFSATQMSARTAAVRHEAVC